MKDMLGWHIKDKRIFVIRSMHWMGKGVCVCEKHILTDVKDVVSKDGNFNFKLDIDSLKLLRVGDEVEIIKNNSEGTFKERHDAFIERNKLRIAGNIHENPDLLDNK